jgi:hypothetical protein
LDELRAAGIFPRVQVRLVPKPIHDIRFSVLILQPVVNGDSASSARLLCSFIDPTEIRNGFMGILVKTLRLADTSDFYRHFSSPFSILVILGSVPGSSKPPM